MTLNDFLKGLKYYYDRQTAVENMEESLKRLRAKLYYSKAGLIERSGGKGNASDYIADALEKQQELEEKIRRNKDILQETDKILSSLSNDEQETVRRRYIEEEPCSSICQSLHVSQRTLYRRIEEIKNKLGIYF